MRPSFLPLLINGPFDDPGVFVPLIHRKRALLFDLGDLHSMAPGDLLKISHVFVSHTHMDHFVGFDQLLRLLLGRAKHLCLYGPPGFLDNVASKLNAYTWNLVHNYDEGLEITATEIHDNRRITQTFQCRSGFEPSDPIIAHIEDPVIHKEPSMLVQTAILDHQTPSLAFALTERYHINIIKAALDQMGLSTGKWIGRFKTHLFEKTDPRKQMEVPCADPQQSPQIWRIGELAKKITRITPGQKIAYVADAVCNQANEDKIIALVHDADHLFIEAAFLQCHRDIAKAKYHLTAHQAGSIARRAGARKITIFHHSPRYADQVHLLEAEANDAFHGRS